MTLFMDAIGRYDAQAPAAPPAAQPAAPPTQPTTGLLSASRAHDAWKNLGSHRSSTRAKRSPTTDTKLPSGRGSLSRPMFSRTTTLEDRPGIRVPKSPV